MVRLAMGRLSGQVRSLRLPTGMFAAGGMVYACNGYYGDPQSAWELEMGICGARALGVCVGWARAT